MKKQGEVIRINAEQYNADGEQISHVEAEWYGFSNDEANEKTMQLVGTIMAVVDQWRGDKAGKLVVKDEGLPPGAIR